MVTRLMGGWGGCGIALGWGGWFACLLLSVGCVWGLGESCCGASSGCCFFFSEVLCCEVKNHRSLLKGRVPVHYGWIAELLGTFFCDRASRRVSDG